MLILNITSCYIQVLPFFLNHNKSLWKNAHILNVISGYIKGIAVFFKNHNSGNIARMSYRVMYRVSPFALRITTDRCGKMHIS